MWRFVWTTFLCVEQRRFVVVLCIYLCNVAVVKTEWGRLRKKDENTETTLIRPSIVRQTVLCFCCAAYTTQRFGWSQRQHHLKWSTEIEYTEKTNTKKNTVATCNSTTIIILLSVGGVGNDDDVVDNVSTRVCKHGKLSAEWKSSQRERVASMWWRGVRDVRQSNREWCSFPRVVVAEATGVPSLYKFTRIHIGTWTCLWSACGQPQHNAVFQSNS